MNGSNSITDITNDIALLNSTVVFKATTQTITGDKTLSGTTTITGNVLANSLTISPTELGYIDGLTSNAQTQINSKVGLTNNETISGNKTMSGTTTFTGDIIANSLTITPTELGYIDGLTSNAQTQLDGKVSKTGADTISGLKTFTTLPESSIVPTTDGQLANKKYVDDTIVAGSFVTLGGTQTISGAKTFSSVITGTGNITVTGTGTNSMTSSLTNGTANEIVASGSLGGNRISVGNSINLIEATGAGGSNKLSVTSGTNTIETTSGTGSNTINSFGGSNILQVGGNPKITTATTATTFDNSQTNFNVAANTKIGINSTDTTLTNTNNVIRTTLGTNRIRNSFNLGYNEMEASGTGTYNFLSATGTGAYNKIQNVDSTGYNLIEATTGSGYNQLLASGSTSSNGIFATGTDSFNSIYAGGTNGYNEFDGKTQNLFKIDGTNKLTIYSNQLNTASPIYLGNKGLVSSISFANATQLTAATTVNLSIATSSLNSGAGQMIFPVPVTIVYVVASSTSTANTAVQSLTFRMNDGATNFITVSGIPAPLASAAQSIVYTPTAYDLPTNTAFFTSLTTNVSSATAKAWVITVFYIQRA